MEGFGGGFADFGDELSRNLDTQHRIDSHGNLQDNRKSNILKQYKKSREKEKRKESNAAWSTNRSL